MLRGTLSLVVVAAFLISGCAAPVKKDPEALPVVWPMPPDLPRFIYETTLYAKGNVVTRDFFDSLSDTLFANKGKKEYLIKPFDVAAKFGRIVVSDTMAGVVHVFDVPARQVFAFSSGGGVKLEKPLGVAIDDNLNIYIADGKLQRVLVFGYQGQESTGHIRLILNAKDGFKRPTDVAVSPSGERIYVVDAGGVGTTQHRVVVFDAAGNQLFEFGERGSQEGQFNLPLQAAYGSDGTLYVLDSGNFRIQAFDKDGKFLRAWGGVGKLLGNLARPRGVALDTDGNVYVTDSIFNNIQVFNPNGELLMPIGGPGSGKNPGEYFLIAGIAVDETNRVYVVDQYFRKIEVLRRLSEEEAKEVLVKLEQRQQAENISVNKLTDEGRPDLNPAH